MQTPAFDAPPAPDRRHGKGAGAVVRPHIHEPAVLGQIIHAVGIGTRHGGGGETGKSWVFTRAGDWLRRHCRPLFSNGSARSATKTAQQSFPRVVQPPPLLTGLFS